MVGEEKGATDGTRASTQRRKETWFYRRSLQEDPSLVYQLSLPAK